MATAPKAMKTMKKKATTAPKSMKTRQGMKVSKAIKEKNDQLKMLRKEIEGLKMMANEAHKAVIQITNEMDVKREQNEQLKMLLKEKEDALWYARDQNGSIGPQLTEIIYVNFLYQETSTT